MTTLGIASDFVLIVLAGLAGGLAARVLRLPLMVGYVAAGVLIGPNTAGPTVVQVHDVELLAEIGVAPWSVGLGLSQIGEFSFALARARVTSGMLSKAAYDLVLTCTVLTMALAPLAAKLALPMGRAWLQRHRSEPAPVRIELPGGSLQGHVVVAGYGRSGKAAARILQRAGIPLVVVEISHSLYSGLARDGFPGIWGDITGEEILKAARSGRPGYFC